MLSNLLGKGLPAQAWGSPGTWQPRSGNLGPAESLRTPCQGKQLAGDLPGSVYSPPPPYSPDAILTSIPLAPFPTMVAVGWGNLETWTTLVDARVQCLSDNRPQELWRKQSEVRS